MMLMKSEEDEETEDEDERIEEEDLDDKTLYIDLFCWRIW